MCVGLSSNFGYLTSFDMCSLLLSLQLSLSGCRRYHSPTAAPTSSMTSAGIQTSIVCCIHRVRSGVFVFSVMSSLYNNYITYCCSPNGERNVSQTPSCGITLTSIYAQNDPTLNGELLTQRASYSVLFPQSLGQ